MKVNDMTVSNRGLSRRTIMHGTAWSLPSVAVAVATPIAAASVTCAATISTTTAAYTRLNSTTSSFTWVNLFGDGKDLTLALAAAPNGASNISPTNNLQLESSTVGGEAQPSVRVAIETADLRNIGGGERVTFNLALDGAPLAVDNLDYKIKDIVGVQAQDGLGGAERVYLSEGTGTYNSDWIRGRGAGDLSPQNIWVGPFSFTAVNPNCTM